MFLKHELARCRSIRGGLTTKLVDQLICILGGLSVCLTCHIEETVDTSLIGLDSTAALGGIERADLHCVDVLVPQVQRPLGEDCILIDHGIDQLLNGVDEVGVTELGRSAREFGLGHGASPLGSRGASCFWLRSMLRRWAGLI